MPTGLAPSIAMLAVVALTIGGVGQMRRPADRRRGALMLACAVVLLGNVVIWTL